jgi:hypothetical protein
LPPTAPPPIDTCFSDRNGINFAQPYARSCAATTGSHSFGYANVGSANGREVNGAFNGIGSGSTSWANGGWTNTAVATAGSSGWTRADLAAGQLKASSDTYTPPGTGDVQFFHLARIGDVLTFNNTSGQTRQLGFNYTYDGAFIDAGGSSSSSGYLVLSYDDLSNGPDYVRYSESQGFFGGSMQTNFDASGQVTDFHFNGTAPDHRFSRFGTPGNGLFGGTASVLFDLPAGVSNIAFAFTLYVQCRVYDSACGFGNTSSLSFDPLPQGVSFTSQSGVFLTTSTPPIPEPGTWALMLAGLAWVGVQQRRRVARA